MRMQSKVAGVVVLLFGLCTGASVVTSELYVITPPKKSKKKAKATTKPAVKGKAAKPAPSKPTGAAQKPREEAKSPQTGASRAKTSERVRGAKPVMARPRYPYRYRGDTVLENRDAQGYLWILQCGFQTMQGKLGPDAIVKFRNSGTQKKPCKLSLQGGTTSIALRGQKLLVRAGRLFEQTVTVVSYPPIPFLGDRSIAVDPKLTRQWAILGVASSQYSFPSWSAMQATGPANVARCSDSTKAWATKPSDGGREWLSVSYKKKVRAVGVVIHASYNPGAVVLIEAKTGAGWTPVWRGKDPTRGTCPVKFAVRFNEPVDTQQIRIVLDTKSVQGWNEIDAVQLVSLP